MASLELLQHTDSHELYYTSSSLQYLFYHCLIIFITKIMNISKKVDISKKMDISKSTKLI